MFDLCNIHLHTRTYLSVGHRDLYARSTEQPKWSIVWSLHKLGTLRLWSSPVRRQQVEKKVYTPLGASATNSANHGGVSDEIWCIVSSFGFGSWKNTVASARECVCMFKGFLLSFDRWDVLGSLLKSWLRYELVLWHLHSWTDHVAMAQDVWRLTWLVSHGVVRKRLVPGVPRDRIWCPLWIWRLSTQLQFLGERKAETRWLQCGDTC